MKKQLIMLTLCFAATILLAPATRAETNPDAQVQQIITSIGDQTAEFRREITSAKTNQERLDINGKYNQKWKESAQQIVQAVLANPTDPKAEEGLRWVIVNARMEPECEQALILYQRYFADSPNFRDICPSLDRNPSTAVEALLRTVMKKNKAKDARGDACFTLAVRLQRTAPKESKKLFNRVVRKYRDIQAPNIRQPLGYLAQQRLYELMHLSIGRVAPELTGSDLDGKRISLSDYRGKIVMVDFFGDW